MSEKEVFSSILKNDNNNKKERPGQVDFMLETISKLYFLSQALFRANLWVSFWLMCDSQITHRYFWQTVSVVYLDITKEPSPSSSYWGRKYHKKAKLLFSGASHLRLVMKETG